MFYRSVEVKHVGSHAEREARRLRTRRVRALAGLAAVAFLTGAVVGGAHSSSSSAHDLAARFAAAWARGDYAAMYSDIDLSARRELSVSDFAAAYVHASVTATATRLQVAGGARDGEQGTPEPPGVKLVAVPVRVHTLLFGTLATRFELPVRGDGKSARIVWSRALLFPGLRRASSSRATPRCPRVRRCSPVMVRHSRAAPRLMVSAIPHLEHRQARLWAVQAQFPPPGARRSKARGFPPMRWWESPVWS